MIEFVVNTELLLIEQWLYRNQRDCFPEMIQTEQGYLSLPAGLKMIYSDQSERHLAKQVVHFTTIDNESVGGFPFNAVTFTLTALATQRTKVRVACERRKLNTAVEQLLSKAAGDYPEAYTAIDAGIRREFYNLPPAGTARKAAGNGSEAAQVEHPAYGTFGVEMWGKINPGHEDKFVEIVCDMAGISPRAIGYQMEPLEAELPGESKGETENGAGAAWSTTMQDETPYKCQAVVKIRERYLKEGGRIPTKKEVVREAGVSYKTAREYLPTLFRRWKDRTHRPDPNKWGDFLEK